MKKKRTMKKMNSAPRAAFAPGRAAISSSMCLCVGPAWTRTLAGPRRACAMNARTRVMPITRLLTLASGGTFVAIVALVRLHKVHNTHAHAFSSTEQHVFVCAWTQALGMCARTRVTPISRLLTYASGITFVATIHTYTYTSEPPSGHVL